MLGKNVCNTKAYNSPYAVSTDELKELAECQIAVIKHLVLLSYTRNRATITLLLSLGQCCMS